jgi:tricorn protease
MADDATLGYVRFPTVHGNTVVFVAEDDLWAVSTDGGIARRLSAGLGPFARPRFSPDGRYLVVIGREEGESDLYRMPAEGGPLTRLTFTGGVAALAGFTPDGQVVAAVTAKVPFPQAPDLYVIPLEGAGGGDPGTRLPWGTATAIAYGPAGGVVLGRKVADLATWKRYRGGTAGELWIDAHGTGDFQLWQAPDHGNLASPMWVGERIYFLSDFEGIGNLYSIRPDGTDLTRHTDHEEYYARNASTDGQRIVYHAGGDLWLWSPDDGESRQIPVAILSQRTQRERRYIDPAPYLNEFAPHPNEDELLLVTRGQLFQLGPFEGPVRQLGPGSGVRQRLAAWLADSGRVVAIDDRSGEERVVSLDPASPDEPQVVWDGDFGQALELAPNPEGTRIGLANNRQELWVVDVATKTASLADSSQFGRLHDLAWSPDGRYLAYACPVSSATTALRVLDAEEGTSHTVTRPVLQDRAPAWDPEGRYLFFLGSRFLDPVYDQVTFDMGFPRAVRPYLVTLSSETPSPFVGTPPAKDGGKGGKGPKESEDDEQPARVSIDFDGIADRVVPFPVKDGRYDQLAALGQKVLWTVFPVKGQLSGDLFDTAPPADGTLEVYDLTTREQETLITGVTRFRLSGNRKHLLYQSGYKLRWVKAGEKPDEKASREPPGRKSGYLDWTRVPVLVDPPAEWGQMLREAWRMMRNRFWSANMSDVNWEAMYRRYSWLLPRLATRGDLSDVLWEMQGELGTSHAYEFGGDYRPAPPYHHGFLGADFVWDEESKGWRVTHIVRGDPSVAGHDSPLRAPGVNVREGDVLVSIDGRQADPVLSPEHLLMKRREQDVALVIKPPTAAPRTVVVRTLATERLARYREWVEKNRAWVHEQGEDRVGYLHVPNMMAWGFSEFYRLFAVEVAHPALIVDVRFNGGGHVSQLLLEKLGRKILGYDYPRWGVPESYPGDAPRGPIVAVTNDWAGSDGDIFSHSFKLMGLGPLVGRRTWGGVIGINVANPLVDRTVVTQPEFSFWFRDVGWGVENYGTDPTIPVDYRPQDFAAGRDPQLERSLQEALTLLEAQPAMAPLDAPRPSRAVPPLPPRR